MPPYGKVLRLRQVGITALNPEHGGRFVITEYIVLENEYGGRSCNCNCRAATAISIVLSYLRLVMCPAQYLPCSARLQSSPQKLLGEVGRVHTVHVVQQFSIA